MAKKKIKQVLKKKMEKKLKQTYPIKDDVVNGEGGRRQATASSKNEGGRRSNIEWNTGRVEQKAALGRRNLIDLVIQGFTFQFHF